MRETLEASAMTVRPLVFARAAIEAMNERKEPDDVSISDDGEVILTWYVGDDFIEVSIKDDGFAYLFKRKRYGLPLDGAEVQIAEPAGALDRILNYLPGAAAPIKPSEKEG